MIVAVTGGKGGVGKTTTALNVAYELDAVAVDADLATADLPHGGGPDLHDVLAERVHPREAIEEFNGVRVLPCGRTLAGARAADLGAFQRVLEQVERDAGRVVVDCPAGIARDVGTELRASDVALIVTTPDRCAIVDALRTRTLALDLETPIAAVVLNRADPETDEPVVERIEQTFGATTTLVADQSPVRNSQAEWRAVAEYDPDCQAAGAYESVATAVRRCERQLTGHIGLS